MKSLIFIMISIMSLAVAGLSEARHLKLYTYDIPEVGATQVTYNFDYVDGPKAGYVSGHPTLHEIEIEHTIMDHWLQSIYVDYDYAVSTGGHEKIAEVSALKTEFNITFFEKNENFADFRLNVELAKMMNSKVSAYGEKNAADTAEFRFIFEKNFDRFSIVLSPILVKEIGGQDELSDWQYGYANAILVGISRRISFGLEFHGSFGTADDFGHTQRQGHTIVPNVDIALSDELTISIGGGFGLTDSSDDFTSRVAIQYIFEPGNL